MKRKLLAALFVAGATEAHQIQVQGGRLKNDIAPSADFGAAVYRHKNYRIGAYSAPQAQGVVASYSSTREPLILEIGQRERSLDQGFLISNGAYLPWTRNFAFAEPTGVRSGYQTKYLAADLQYYQLQQQNLAAARLHLLPFSWLRLSGGVAVPEIQATASRQPVGSLLAGNLSKSDGFLGGFEYAGGQNYLLHARYSDGFMLRTFAFRRSEINPLASGIFEASEGLAAQFISDAWFAQFFATDSRFGMLRYAGDYLTGVAVYEEKNQLAGFSVRNNPKGLHLRSGATVSQNGSLQTLAGLGYADLVFVGGGHYQLSSDQPLEPIIFPSEWYSSVLLQSTSMRMKDQGYKLLALVDAEVIQGFFAVTYAQDFRQRERFEFYMRVAGSFSF